MKKNLLSLALLLMLTVGAWAQSGYWDAEGNRATSFSEINEGNKTISITSAAELALLAYNVNEGVSDYSGYTITLSSDLDLESHYWTAIGSFTNSKPFNGTFDGNGNTLITPKNQDLTSEGYHGLFGYIGTSGKVMNLQLEESSFVGTEYCGSIACYNLGIIENCRVAYYLYGSVWFTTNDGSCFGGIAAYNGGTIKECVCAASVHHSGNDLIKDATCVGGIVGHNAAGGTVQNCLYLGSTIEGSSYVGAIAGKNEGTLTNNYYHDNKYFNRDIVGTTVLGVGTSGALTGADAAEAAKAKVVKLPEGGTFAEPYGATISGTPTLVTTNNPNNLPLSVYTDGLLFDDGYVGDKMDNAFYTTATTVELEATNVPDGYAATFSTTSDGASVSGSTLTVGTDVTEISVSAQRVATGWLAEGVRAASFSTTGTNSITIMSAAELGLLAYNVNFDNQTYEGYTITIDANEIDLADHTWEPIGYGLQGAMYGQGGFLGTFNGAVKPIKNMKVTGSSAVGLFSVVPSGATVKNVVLSSPLVKGENYVGAIAGSVSGIVENCHISYGSVEFVEASNSGVGMVVYPGGGQSAQMGLGGIAGMLSGGSIKGCTVVEMNIYPVIASAQGVGGIVGVLSAGSGFDYQTHEETIIPAILKDCLFAGNMFKKDGNNYVGAIAGMNREYTDPNTITNNYYVDGGTPLESVTLNTTLLGINGADTDGAKQAYIYSSKPENFGNAVTNYGYGMEAYSAGLHYNLNWYSPTEPTTMDITLSDTEDNSTTLKNYKGIQGVKVTLDRTLWKDGGWNTICLPFTVDINDNDNPSPLDGAELWQVSTTDDSGYDEDTQTLTLNFENCRDDDGISTIIAGYPYLIKWENGSGTLTKTDLVFNDVTIEKTSPIAESFGNNDEITFIGTFASKPFATKDRSVLFLGGDNNLYYPDGEKTITIGAFRAYFQLNGITAGDPVNPQSGNVRQFVLNFGGEETGIKSMGDLQIDDLRFDAEAWYNLDGRKLDGKPSQRGIYVNNGHKIVIQ